MELIVALFENPVVEKKEVQLELEGLNLATSFLP
jgi:hypothetical protein